MSLSSMYKSKNVSLKLSNWHCWIEKAVASLEYCFCDATAVLAVPERYHKRLFPTNTFWGLSSESKGGRKWFGSLWTWYWPTGSSESSVRRTTRSGSPSIGTRHWRVLPVESRSMRRVPLRRDKPTRSAIVPDADNAHIRHTIDNSFLDNVLLD